MSTTVINFVFESGISLIIFTLVYMVFLRKETFFVLNRLYLMAAVIFSILLPFIHFQASSTLQSVMLGEVTVTALRYQNLLETVTVYGTRLSGAFEQTIRSIGLIKFIYLSGTVFFSLLFLYRLLQITSLIMYNESERKDGIRIVKIDRDTTPFSFFNFVFINRNYLDSPGLKEMVAHETEHVRQKHSFDVMIIELLTISQWFNPFIWLLQRSIRENHEFLADHGVLKPGVSSAAYRLLLLGSSFEQQPVIANNFNYSLTKIRIKMITQIKSSKTAALKLSMGLLVTATLLMSFAFDNEKYTFRDNNPSNQSDVAVGTSQQKESQTKDKVYKVVDQMPEFPGGNQALMTFIGKEVKYPADAVKAGIQGKVYVTFVVDKDGKVMTPNVIKSANPSLDKEALRVIGKMPTWIPGKQGGKNVAVEFTLPINFALK
ncbi:MAG: M56 family metallopeptidase [Prolixibacteraceae bacterium]|nr:M56 family metallopeptidase [Prolixibacteraceae bacterium]